MFVKSLTKSANRGVAATNIWIAYDLRQLSGLIITQNSYLTYRWGLIAVQQAVEVLVGAAFIIDYGIDSAHFEGVFLLWQVQLTELRKKIRDYQTGWW